MNDAAAEWVAQQVAPGRFSAVRWVAETGSTNADLLEAARNGADEQVLITDFQSAGRGRRDRRWESPPGVSLMMSVLVRHNISADRFFGVTIAMGLAARQALAEVGVTAKLKWPNDVMIDGRKVAGILAEAALQPTPAVVVGMGLNVAPGSVTSLPPELAARATCVADHAEVNGATRNELAAKVLQGLAARLGRASRDLLAEYRDHLLTIGQTVTVSRIDDVPLEGRAVGVSERGELRVESGGREFVISVGDVAHVRPK